MLEKTISSIFGVAVFTLSLGFIQDAKSQEAVDPLEGTWKMQVQLETGQDLTIVLVFKKDLFVEYDFDAYARVILNGNIVASRMGYHRYTNGELTVSFPAAEGQPTFERVYDVCGMDGTKFEVHEEDLKLVFQRIK